MINVDVDYNTKVNYTTELNNISLIRNIKIENKSTTDYNYLYLEILFPNDVVKKNYVKKFSLIKEAYYNLEIFEDVNLDLAFLSAIEETNQYTFEINILKDEKIVFSQDYFFEVLPFNHWLGMATRPDLIASFVSPNNRNITKIISEAAKIARANDFTMSGYQSGLSKNVRKQINAVFESIKSLDINYVSIPPSFEQTGQKVRSIDEIVEFKLANCLDIAVLAASCLEAISLNPFIIMVKEHAFVGAWLEDKTYSDSVIEDRSFFMKRLSKGVREVELFESTLLTTKGNYSYEVALTEAEDKIEIVDNFIMAIDIKQARKMMIKPLPSKRVGINADPKESVSKSEATVYIEEVDYKKDDILLSDKTARDKIKNWESKLLDLTLRNNLLNFVPYNRNISLVENDLSVLEDKLSTGSEFSILAAPDFIETENRKEKVFSYTRRSRSNYIDYMNSEIKNNRLVSLHSEKELDRSLRLLFRESRTSLQENGSNSLFLAIGFLKWFESDLSEKPRFSPIILYPVEIVRKGGGSGYKIRSRDEEIQINTTLLEKIRNDLEIEIPGLNPLPQDDSGIDVTYILNTMRTAVKDKKRWDVVEWSYLGIFSFNQFVMWEDLRTRKDDVMKNRNIKAILGQSQQKAELIEENYQPLFLMPADSSQALAIKQSLKGEDFVLYGPPGTGKSQTITNIIASSLYNGRTVLFVAEKMAALEVVQERLSSIGLSDFSLELHSNKSKKSEVLNNLGSTLNVEKRGRIAGFEEELEKYDMTRKEAKDLLLLVNLKQDNNMTLYEMLNTYAEVIEEEDIEIGKNVYSNFSAEKIDEWKKQVQEVEEQAKLLTKIKNHGLSSITVSSMKIKEKEKVVKIISELSELINKIIDKSSLYDEKDFLLGSLEENILIRDLIRGSISEDVYFQSYLTQYDDESYKQITNNLFSLEERRIKQLQNIEKEFNKDILNENIEMLENEWQTSELTWFLPKFLKQNSILKVLNKHSISDKVVKEDVVNLIKRLKEYKGVENKISVIFESNKELFMEIEYDGQFDFDNFEKVHNNTVAFKEDAIKISNFEKTLPYDVFKDKFVRSRFESRQTYANLPDLDNMMDILVSKLDEFEKLTGAVLKEKKHMNWLEMTLNTFESMNRDIKELDLWLNYNMSKTKLIDQGLVAFINEYENNNGDYNLLGTIIKNVSYRYIVDLVDADENLYGFSGISSNLKLEEVNNLKNIINKTYEIDLYERLAQELPDNKFEANPNSEIGYLKKAIGNGGRGISLRELFSNAPNALQKVAPCMLMSPISVAQYISPNNPKFDLIIFDEASQVETHRAIGAISRGSQLIVVGDPKQLPPTSFFTTTIEDESFEESDLPSILDELISLSFSEYYLKWHYRSNHESLITFSNQTYYDDGLYTFPSISNKVKKVNNININGVFGVPQSGQNQREADAILNYLKDLLVSKKDLSRSIGVVTFNQPQRTLILDMIDKEMDKSKDFSESIESLPEEFFVKNIENVQGDERDLIIFSIGFGPKEDGKMSMNFGPINQKGGSKRLNVAVTRARDEMLVFSSFSATKIDLNRTSKKGPRDLKKFLEFAQSELTMHSNNNDQELNKDHILIQIKEELKLRGYDSDIKLGTSGFKIDLAIADPNEPEQYIGAVIIDGGFSKEDSLDDRVSTQKIMLQRLGWKVINLWSLDWLINRTVCIESILKNLELDEEISEPDTIEKLEFEFDSTDNGEYHEYYSCLTEKYLENINYVTADAFYENTAIKRKASTIVESVVRVEAPILFDTLCRRVMKKFDLTVLTDKLREHFFEIISSSNVYLDNELTVWTDEESKDHYSSFRIPGEKRAFLEIPKCEIRNAVMYVLKNQLSLSTEELFREVFKVFGYNMLGEKAQDHMSMIISGMEDDLIDKENDRYNIKE